MRVKDLATYFKFECLTKVLDGIGLFDKAGNTQFSGLADLAAA